jgi:hypothetical protein
MVGAQRRSPIIRNSHAESQYMGLPCSVSISKEEEGKTALKTKGISAMNMNMSVFTMIPITRYGTQRAVHSG